MQCADSDVLDGLVVGSKQELCPPPQTAAPVQTESFKIAEVKVTFSESESKCHFVRDGNFKQEEEDKTPSATGQDVTVRLNQERELILQKKTQREYLLIFI